MLDRVIAHGARPYCGRLAQLEERLVYTEEVGGSSPSSPTIPKVRWTEKWRSGALDTLWAVKYTIDRPALLNSGGVAQLVRAPACHAGGRRFKSGHSRHAAV